MDTIIASLPIVAPSLILLLIILAVGCYFAIKVNRLSVILLAVSIIGAVASLIEGVRFLERHNNLPIAGAIMIAAGLGVIVSIGIALRSSEKI